MNTPDSPFAAPPAGQSGETTPSRKSRALALLGIPNKSTAWPCVIVILLLPLVTLWRQDNLIFAPAGIDLAPGTPGSEIDSWVYWGLFQNLAEYKRHLFPQTYYG